MKILLISDKVVEHIYSNSITKRLRDIDFIISCGDLPNYYLEFLVSTLNKPLFYVLGNHDGKIIYTDKGSRPILPEGCINIDGKIIEHRGLLIGGLEGSMRYSKGSMQYTEKQMCSKAVALKPRLYLNKLLKRRYIDILVTHAPPFNINDSSDLCHTGFKCFEDFIKKYSPKYLIHGHIHLYGTANGNQKRLYNTEIINAYGHMIIDI